MRHFLRLTTFLSLFFLPLSAIAQVIDLEIIAKIESSNNPLAYNLKTKATGLLQITPICLTEYNIFHKTDYRLTDMFKVKLSFQIADWYLHTRIPQMLRYYKKPITIETVLTCYNAGIAYVVHNRVLPKETVRYITRYKKGG